MKLGKIAFGMQFFFSFFCIPLKGLMPVCTYNCNVNALGYKQCTDII